MAVRMASERLHQVYCWLQLRKELRLGQMTIHVPNAMWMRSTDAGTGLGFR